MMTSTAMKINKNNWVFCALLCIALTGCGYTLRTQLKSNLAHPKKVFIAPLRNSSLEVGAETIFTNAFIRMIRTKTPWEITSSEKDADHVLSGELDIHYQATSFTGVGYGGLFSYSRIPAEFETVATVQVWLMNTQSREHIWSGRYSTSRRLSSVIDRTYDFQAPSSLGANTHSSMALTYPLLADNIVQTAYDDLINLD